MSAPRRVLPGTTYLLTRRCSERRFFLRPGPKVNAVILYALALASNRFGVQLHAFGFLSNHYHLVITDCNGRLPLFMHCLDLLVARALNAHFRRFEPLWAAGSYSAVSLPDSDTVLDKIAYSLANPVAAGLVATSSLWPGVISSSDAIGQSPRLVPRPPQFFRRDTPLALPAAVPLAVVPPPGFEDLPLATVRSLVAVRLAEHEERARRARRGRPIVGRRRVLRQHICERPNDHEPHFRLNPRVAGRDKWKRIEALQGLRKFLAAYRRAWEQLKAGLREVVVFPAGTWKLRRELGVTCEAPS